MKKKITYLSLLLIAIAGCIQTQKAPESFKVTQEFITPIFTTHPRISIITDLPSSIPVLTQPSPKKLIITPESIVKTLKPVITENPPLTSTPEFYSGLYPLRIVGLGPMSKVISPIELIVHVNQEYTGSTRIELIGEDGAELFRKIFKTYSNIGYYTRITEKIDFEIQAVAEIARLQVSTFDKNGQMQALNSVRLLLQSVGENKINIADDSIDRTLLRFPKPGEKVKGGLLEIMAEFKPVNSLPVIVELVTSDGIILGSRILKDSIEDRKFWQISTSIPYSVKSGTSARLIIRQTDDRIPGLSYFFSEKLILSP